MAATTRHGMEKSVSSDYWSVVRGHYDDNFDTIDDLIPFKIRGEEPSDAPGVTLTLAHTPVANTLQLFKNGLRMKEADGEGFTRSGVTITLTTAKEAGDWFCADYEY